MIMDTQKDLNMLKNSRTQRLVNSSLKMKTLKQDEIQPSMLGNTRYLGLMSSVLSDDDKE